MKRFFASVMAFLYLSTSMGATLHLHYCMGKLVGWGLKSHESAACAFCGMEKKTDSSTGIFTKKNCCRDDHKEIKTAGDQKLVQTEFQFLKLIPDVSLEYAPTFSSLQFHPEFSTQSVVNGTPKAGKQPVFLLNCNFRI